MNADGQAADAQDNAITAAGEEQSSAAETQRNQQAEGSAAAAGADEGDYDQERDHFLKDPDGFLAEHEEKDGADSKDEGADAGDGEGEGSSDGGEGEGEGQADDEGQSEGEGAGADAGANTVGEKKDDEGTDSKDEDADSDRPAAKRKHINLARMGEEKSRLVVYLDRNPDVTITDAIRILGLKITPDEAGDSSGQSNAAASDLPKTVEDTAARIEQLWDERTKAMGEELDFKKAAELDRKIANLEKHKASLVETAASADRTEREGFETKLAESKRKAVLYYPDCSKKDSAFVKKMVEIDKRLEETEDDRFHSPEKPFIVAKLAAAELGVSPRDPNKPAAAETAAKPGQKSTSPVPAKRQAVPSPVQPASPRARTNSQSGPDATLESEVDNIQSDEDYERVKHKVLAGSK